MPKEKTFLQKAMDNLYEALREQQTDDKELRNRIQKAINETDAALELAKKREKGRPGGVGDEEDVWLG